MQYLKLKTHWIYLATHWTIRRQNHFTERPGIIQNEAYEIKIKYRRESNYVVKY